MAVVGSATLIHHGRGCREDIRGVRTYSSTYKVITDDPEDGPQVVLTASGLPVIGAAYAAGNDADANAYCRDRAVRTVADKARTLWHVQCEYTTDLDPAQLNPNPLARPPRYSLEFSQYTTVWEKDLDDLDFVNTVGERFDPPYEEEIEYPDLRVTKNIAASAFITWVGYAQEYNNQTNNNTFYGAAAGKVKVRITIGETQSENGVDFHQVSMTFSYNPKGWNPELLNAGRSYKDDEGDVVQATDKYDQPLSDPVRLDEDGTRLGDEDPGHYITFRTKNQKDFSTLGV